MNKLSVISRTAKVMLFAAMLSACSPKATYLYQYPTTDEFKVKQLVLVVDYLNLKDDVGKYWDFDSQEHQQVLNRLLSNINHLLQTRGYPAINTYLLGSGLLIKTDFAVEHYIQDKEQQELLYPPYILASQNINEKQIAQHQEILTLLVKYIAPRRHSADDALSQRSMQLGYQLEAVKLPENSTILYLHIDSSAPGAFKQLATFLLSGAIASQADYAQIHLDTRAAHHASAFLIHQNQGQIVWKNFSPNWTADQPIEALLKSLPYAH